MVASSQLKRFTLGCRVRGTQLRSFFSRCCGLEGGEGPAAAAAQVCVTGSAGKRPVAPFRVPLPCLGIYRGAVDHLPRCIALPLSSWKACEYELSLGMRDAPPLFLLFEAGKGSIPVWRIAVPTVEAEWGGRVFPKVCRRGKGNRAGWILSRAGASERANACMCARAPP